MRLEGTAGPCELGEGATGLCWIESSGKLQAGGVVTQSAFGNTTLAAMYRGAHPGAAPVPAGVGPATPPGRPLPRPAGSGAGWGSAGETDPNVGPQKV